jgi:hypothetical protein
MNDPLAEDSMIVLRDMFPLMNEDLLYDTFMQNAANLQDTIDHLVSLENNDTPLELLTPQVRQAPIKKPKKQSSNSQQQNAQKQSHSKVKPDQNYQKNQNQYFQDDQYGHQENSEQENPREEPEYEEESSDCEEQQEKGQAYQETEKINSFLADEEYARQQSYFERQQGKALQDPNSKFYDGKGGNLEKNRRDREGYYNWEPLPGELVNTILSETKNSQRELRDQHMLRINKTIGNYNAFWKKNPKDKIKAYSNIKFNDDSGKDEDNFYFENMGLPANINENIDIDIFFDDDNN